MMGRPVSDVAEIYTQRRFPISDRMPAEIWIGGKVPLSLVPALCAAIGDQGVSQEWGDAPFRPSTAEDLGQAIRENDRGVRLLWLCDCEAGGGVFEELEAFLQEHKIAYTRESTGRYEFDPETVDFRPGHPLAPQATNSAGEPVLLVSELAPVADLLAAAIDLSESASADTWSLVKTARQLFQEQLPPTLPPLEALRSPRTSMVRQVNRGKSMSRRHPIVKTVRAVKGVQGLAISYTAWRESQGLAPWAVEHVAGVTVCYCQTEEEAEETARKLAPLADWTKPMPRHRYQEILDRLQGKPWSPNVNGVPSDTKNDFIRDLVCFLFKDGDAWNLDKDVSGADLVEWATGRLTEMGLTPPDG